MFMCINFIAIPRFENIVFVFRKIFLGAFPESKYCIHMRVRSNVYAAKGDNVLSMARVTLAHHRCRFECRRGDLTDGQLLVVRLLGRDDRRVG